MPKKYQTENTKAVEARSRKADKAATVKANRQKELDDEYWKDDDKKISKKNNRKEEKEQKRQQEINRKKENRSLEEQEKAGLSSSAKAPPSKVTSYQIQLHRDAEKKEESTNTLTHLEMPLVENLNRDIGEAVVGSGIEGALKAMSDADENPKMSVAAAFAAFKSEKLPLLKQENPKLKLSQLNDQIRKEWKRSPANPLNQR